MPTATLSTLIAHAAPSDAARFAAAQGMIDYWACALPVAWGAVPDTDLAGLRAVFTASTLENQALRLGYIAHALDFDDFLAGFRGHPSAVIFSTLLPLLHIRHSSMQELLDAAVIGVEVAGRLGRAAGVQHYPKGFHNSATLGCIAATAAGARLLSLGVQKTAVALGLAATQAAGLRSQFGSNAKPLHIGLAARNALTSVRLAEAGFGGVAEGVLESFVLSHGGELADVAYLVQDWTPPWQVLEPGLEFKAYPTCSATHSAIEAALALRTQWLTRFASVETALGAVQDVVVSFPRGADTATSVRRPTNGIQARFSLEYVIADALLHGAINPAHYLDRPPVPRIIALAEKIRREVDATAPDDASNPSGRFHTVAIELVSGERFQERVSRAQTVARPVDVTAKLRRQLQLVPQVDALKILQLCTGPFDHPANALLAYVPQDIPSCFCAGFVKHEKAMSI
jgi:2-methylcitrate dehydratase PrpD